MRQVTRSAPPPAHLQEVAGLLALGIMYYRIRSVRDWRGVFDNAIACRAAERGKA